MSELPGSSRVWRGPGLPLTLGGLLPAVSSDRSTPGVFKGAGHRSSALLHPGRGAFLWQGTVRNVPVGHRGRAGSLPRGQAAWAQGRGGGWCGAKDMCLGSPWACSVSPCRLSPLRCPGWHPPKALQAKPSCSAKARAVQAPARQPSSVSTSLEPAVANFWELFVPAHTFPPLFLRRKVQPVRPTCFESCVVCGGRSYECLDS